MRLGIIACFVLLASCGGPAADGGWARHTIDDSSFGADGVRLADVNGDGRLDITSPWEEGGEIRVYFHPGDSGLRDRWPAVTVGKVGDPEDSFFVDLDGDGAVDVVSSCEGKTQSMYVHWAPADKASLADPAAWQTEELPAASGEARWMYAFAMQVDGRFGVDLVAGSKAGGGGIGWFEAPENPRDLAAWRWHPLYESGWVMTLRPYDVDFDGDLDIVGTDRRGPGRGALWLERPEDVQGPWSEHRIGAVDKYEAMHNAVADLDQDGLDDVIAPARGGAIMFHRRTRKSPPMWETHEIPMPPNTGVGKAVQVADVDLDGRQDLVVSCARADEGKSGLFWMSNDEPSWSTTSISGPEGFIFDLIQLTDLDGDGDLDVVALEQNEPEYGRKKIAGLELGVVWYENPTM